MKNLSKTISCFILWSFSTLFSFILVFVLQEFFVIIMESLGWSEYTVNLFDKLSIIVIGIITVIFFLYIQHAYHKKQWFLFFLVSSIQLLIYGLTNFLKQVLLNFHIPVLQGFDYLFFIFMVFLSSLSFYFYCLLKRRQI